MIDDSTQLCTGPFHSILKIDYVHTLYNRSTTLALTVALGYLLGNIRIAVMLLLEVAPGSSGSLPPPSHHNLVFVQPRCELGTGTRRLTTTVGE